MFRSILVPLDGTREAAGALRLARQLAETAGGMHLLTVLPQATGQESREVTAYLEHIAANLRSSGVRVDISVGPGQPGPAILAYARTHGVDLIVLETRGVSNRSILGLTSVARQILTDAPAPVFMLHPGSVVPNDMRTVLVPVHGSPGGSLALAAARALAHTLGSRIVLLNVVVPVPARAFAALPGMTLGGYIDPYWEELARTTAHEYVAGLAARLANVGVEAEAHVATGDVSSEILRCADEVDADSIVMSTHSISWPARAWVGSVADRVLRDGTRPVLLVQREPPASEAKPENRTDFVSISS